MNKRFLYIGILACIVVLAVGINVVVNRKEPMTDPTVAVANNTVDGVENTVQEVLSPSEDDSEIVITAATIASGKPSEKSYREENAAPEGIPMVDENVQPVSQQAVEVKAEGSAESGDIVRGESASASDEIEEVELPMEADLP